MATTKPLPFTVPDPGERLTDARSIMNAIVNQNGSSSTYAITATGTTAANATELFSVLNQVDTTAASTGVNLPLSTGRRSTPFQICFVVNNGANPLNIYGFPGSSDTINGTAGTTAYVLPAGATTVFVSVKGGAWFTTNTSTAIPAGQAGTFTANGVTPVTVANANITANSQVLVTLKTVGGTVGTSLPNVRTITPGTGFTIAGIASDTSIYNYAIIG